MPNTFQITTPKQKNGLWGTPMTLLKLDRVHWENQLLQSAILVGIAQCYPNETFIVCLSSDEGFSVRLSKSGWIGIRYENYELQGDVLTYVGPYTDDSIIS